MADRINYRQVAHDEHSRVIAPFMRLMSTVETAHAYDFWGACWLLSLAAGRRTVVARPRAPVFLNVYAILTAESGITRKSTAVSECRKFGTQLCETDEAQWELIEAKLIPERLEGSLSQQSTDFNSANVCICVSELISVFGRQGYAMGAPGLLTDLYDCPSVRRSTKTTQSSTMLRNVYPVLLGASTLSWLLSAINPTVIEGGFTSRCLFITSEKPKQRIPWPEDQDDQELRLQVASALSTIRAECKSRSEITLNESALSRFKNWYNTRPLHEDVFRQSFEAREDGHALRLAALLAIDDGTWMIQDRHLMHAVKIITEVKQAGFELFGSPTMVDKLALSIDKLRRALVGAGVDGISQSTLSARLGRDIKAAELNIALGIMHEIGCIQKFHVQHKMGRPLTVWRATKGINADGVIAAVKQKLAESVGDET